MITEFINAGIMPQTRQRPRFFPVNYLLMTPPFDAICLAPLDYSDRNIYNPKLETFFFGGVELNPH
jgi:hypothetical protein